MADRRTLKLGAFIHPTGHHIASWRHPDAHAEAAVDFPHYVALAQTAERGLFDFLFLADSPAMRAWPDETVSRVATYVTGFEPVTLLAALSGFTRHLGLVATVTATYNEPFHVARKFASLDHISGGRAGWNLVTSVNPAEAWNFGYERHPDHAARYGRAREFARIVRGLWDSWDDDAFVRDRDSGRYFDPAKVHRLDHKGEHFTVRGPLNVPRPPQGQPVIVQAGASEDGRDTAAEFAEIVFTSQQTPDSARDLYRDLKQRMAKFGRSPDQMRIMPGMMPVIGDTREAAAADFERLQSLVHPAVGLRLLEEMLGNIDLSAYPLDGPLPEIVDSNAGRHALKLFTDMARREGLTIRQMSLRAVSRGHFILCGTATDIADEIQRWFEAEAADGFNLMPPYLPGGLDRFVDEVVPELQRRGLFRTAYEGTTLRDNLGLTRPAAIHGRPATQAAAGA